MMGGRGTIGTVTEVAADHYTIKTETGDVYTVHYSVNTRIMKQTIRRHAPGEARDEGDAQPAAPQTLKPTDIKLGDVIAANGEVDAAAKSVGAVFIVQIDPERAKQMREMETSYGKTWLMGKVTSIDGVKVTIQSARDNTARSIVADENTIFRKRRDPITLADIQVGDMIRVEGTAKDGTFLATTVGDMGAPQPEGMPTVPRAEPPQ
jgi:preprotein translocase subunit YajC